MYGNNTGTLTSKANEISRGSLNLEPIASPHNHKDLGMIDRGGKRIVSNPNKNSTVATHMLNSNSHEP